MGKNRNAKMGENELAIRFKLAEGQESILAIGEEDDIISKVESFARLHGLPEDKKLRVYQEVLREAQRKFPGFQSVSESPFDSASAGGRSKSLEEDEAASWEKVPSQRSPEAASPKPRPEAARPEAFRPEVFKPEVFKPEVFKPEFPRSDVFKPEAPRADAFKLEVPRPETPKPQVPRPEPPRPLGAQKFDSGRIGTFSESQRGSSERSLGSSRGFETEAVPSSREQSSRQGPETMGRATLHRSNKMINLGSQEDPTALLLATKEEPENRPQLADNVGLSVRAVDEADQRGWVQEAGRGRGR